MVLVHVGPLSTCLYLVNKLVVPIIFGIDFLLRHQLTLDFGCTLAVNPNKYMALWQVEPWPKEKSAVQAISKAEQYQKSKRYAGVMINAELTGDSVDECAIPHFLETVEFQDSVWLRSTECSPELKRAFMMFTWKDKCCLALSHHRFTSLHITSIYSCTIKEFEKMIQEMWMMALLRKVIYSLWLPPMC